MAKSPTKAELAVECEFLRYERDHYKELAEVGLGPRIKEMKLEDGSFNLAVTGPMVEAMAIAVVGQFKSGGAKNYMEMSLTDRDEPYQRYVVTVQKVGAKSPADLLNDANQRIAELERQIA